MTQNTVSIEAQLANLGVSLHRAIADQLIGEVEQAINDGRIRSQGGMHSVYDFTREFLDKKNARDGWKRLTASVPDIVGFCDFISFSQNSGRAGRKTPVTDMAGLVWIALTANCEFSFKLRTASTQLILAERQSSPKPLANPTEKLERSLEATRDALQNFPYTLERIWAISGIVNKSQVKGAIIRDFIEGRDYTWADDLLCVNESTAHILFMCFRSMKGTDVSQLPELIQVNTREYFKHHHKKKNIRTAQIDENQLSLFDI